MLPPTMIRFIQLLPKVSGSGDFLLQDLPGSGKRIDILCRDLAACFEWGPSRWHPSQLELLALIGDSIVLRFTNPKEALPRGERAWAELIKRSLKNDPPDYVSVSNEDLESLIERYNKPPQSNLWILYENGNPVEELKFNIYEAQNSFMLGDHTGFDSITEKLISNYNLRKVSLGDTSYLSSHCIASIISEFEGMVK